MHNRVGAGLRGEGRGRLRRPLPAILLTLDQ
jgi:hypothetical protein